LEIKEGFIRRQDFMAALDMLSIKCLYTHIPIEESSPVP